ncbi:MAG: LysE family translocator [Nocardioidaceae bacterium]
MAVASVLAFWAAALLLIIAPGLDWAFTLSCVLQERSVLAAAAGLMIGYTAMTLVVAAGLGTLLAHTPVALTVLSVAGGLYLMWLGATTLTSRGASTIARRKAFGSNRDVLLKGIGVSGLNPKALLLFVALLPQFANPSWPWPLPIQLGLLGMVFTLTCTVFYPCLGTVARKAVLSRPAATRVLTVVSGVSMLIIGAALIAERLIA